MLSVFLLWRNTLWPRLVGADKPMQGYRLGLRQTLVLSVGIFSLLLAGAIYEPIAAIYFVPLLG